MRAKEKIVLIFLILWTTNNYTQEEWYDSTFGPSQTGIVTTAIGVNNSTFALTLQADAQIITAGQSDNAFIVIRYNAADGSVDTTFNGVGYNSTVVGSSAYATTVTMQNNDIIAAGAAIINNVTTTMLARYTSAGILDDTFGIDANGIVIQPVGTDGDAATAVVVDANDNSMVTGIAVFDGQAHGFIMRFDPVGVLDPLYGTDGITIITAGHHTFLYALSLDGNGNSIVGGSTSVVGGTDLFLTRVDTNGSIDTSFGVDGIVTTHINDNNQIRALTLDGAGNIVVAGYAHNNALTNESLVVVRYTNTGSPDATFGVGGVVTIPVARGVLYGIAIDDDSKIVVTGVVDSAFFTARLNSDGTIDTTFADDGFITTQIDNPSGAYAIAIQPDTKILVAGHAANKAALVRYKSSLDDSVFITNPLNQSTLTRELVAIRGSSSFANETIDVFIDDLMTPVASVMTDGSGNWDAGSFLVSNGVHRAYAQREAMPASRDAKLFTVDTSVQDTAPGMLLFSDSGVLPTGIRFMYPGTGLSTSEISIRVPQALVVRSIAVKALVSPGLTLTDSWTLRRNGADTALAVSLSDLQTEAVNSASPIVFNAGDELGIKTEGDLLTTTANIVVVLEVH